MVEKDLGSPDGKCDGEQTGKTGEGETSASILDRARRAFRLGSELSEEAKVKSMEVEQTNNAGSEIGLPGEECEESQAVKLGSLPEVPDENIAQPTDEASETEQLEQQLQESQDEAKENFEKYLRAIADFENYKKRTLRERADLLKYAGEHLARDIVDVVDDLDRALAQKVYGSAEELLEGVRLIYSRLIGALEKHSIKGQDAVGQTFDPNTMDAIANVPSEKHPTGVVIEQLKKPYSFKDKILRHGQVVVSSGLNQSQPCSAGDSSDNDVESSEGGED